MEVLIREVCKVWRPHWNGIFLARAVWEQGENKNSYENTDPMTTVSEKRRVLIHTENSQESLKVYLLPSKAFPIQTAGCLGSPLYWDCFSRSMIVDFCHSIGDKNSLHSQVPAIVPGLLILQKLVAFLPPVEMLQISFHSPIYENDKIYLSDFSSHIEGSVGKIRCFSIFFRKRGSKDE